RGTSAGSDGTERGDIRKQSTGSKPRNSNGIGHGVVFASHCPSGNSGSAELCSFASSLCAVLGKFMGRAPAATAAAVQSLCAAAVQSLWRGRGGAPKGGRGFSSKGGLLFPPQGTAKETAPRKLGGGAPPLL